MLVRRVLGTPARLMVHASPSASRHGALTVYTPQSRLARYSYTLGIVAHQSSVTPLETEADASHLVRLFAQNDREFAMLRPRGRGRMIIGIERNKTLDIIVKSQALPAATLENERTLLEALANCNWLADAPRLLGDALDGARYSVAMTALRSGPARFDRRRDPEALLELVLRFARAGVTHGDLAPWNVRTTESIGTLAAFDWEHGKLELEPLFDLTYYLVQSGAMLGWLSPEACVFHALGPSGIASRYAHALGLSESERQLGVRDYVDRARRGALPGDVAPVYLDALARALDRGV